MHSPNSTAQQNPATAAAERRRSGRVPTHSTGTIRNANQPSEPEHRIQVFDVSLHGVGFRTIHPVACEQTFLVEIGTGPLFLSGTIRITSSRQRPDGLYDVGGDFI